MLNTSALLDAERNISREKDTRNISIHDCEIEKNSSPTNDNELLTLQQSE